MASLPPTGKNSAADFALLAPGVGAGSELPAGWQRISLRPLLILVGPTGVGKSTTVKQLARLGLRFTLLPDRRVLTDRLIIAPLAAAAGRSQPVTDRLERLEYARCYRQQHPGGMSEILQQVAIAENSAQPLLIFDGLRGEAEVSHASRSLPNAAFAMLIAPDKIRLLRMLHRADPFDRAHAEPVAISGSEDKTLAALGVPEASAYFKAEEIAELWALVQAGIVTQQELRGKLRTIVEQARIYQPAATQAALERLAGRRAAILNTASLSPDRVADMIVSRLRALWPSLRE